jgi:Arc/MetJ family transcription regulator
MATNLALDDRLIEEARRVGRHKTKREAVSAALAEYVNRRKQLRILDAFGTVDFDPNHTNPSSIHTGRTLAAKP